MKLKPMKYLGRVRLFNVNGDKVIEGAHEGYELVSVLFEYIPEVDCFVNFEDIVFNKLDSVGTDFAITHLGIYFPGLQMNPFLLPAEIQMCPTTGVKQIIFKKDAIIIQEVSRQLPGSWQKRD